jgi:hypothetical protein
MTVYPIELHRRLEQKWVRRIEALSKPPTSAPWEPESVATEGDRAARRQGHLGQTRARRLRVSGRLIAFRRKADMRGARNADSVGDDRMPDVYSTYRDAGMQR